jgi:hypothetical protein
MKPKKVILYIVLVILLAFLAWIVASALIIPSYVFGFEDNDNNNNEAYGFVGNYTNPENCEAEIYRDYPELNSTEHEKYVNGCFGLSEMRDRLLGGKPEPTVPNTIDNATLDQWFKDAQEA